MEFSLEEVLIVSSFLLLISILANKSLGRFGIPALLLFLAVGMLAGSEGIGGIEFDNPKVAQWLGTVALAFILFSGGLDTKKEAIKPIVRQGISLSLFGVLCTALLLGFFVSLLPGFTLLEGLLVGSIVSSTDAAAVFSILRTRRLGLKNNMQPMLELESGSNDPMAYFLTVLFTFLMLNPESGYGEPMLMFFRQMVVGLVAGVVMGYFMPIFTNRIKLPNEGLYPVFTLSLVVITYAATAQLGGNGFLAVYIAGIIMGNQNFIHKKSLFRFFDGISWLMQILIFLTLGLLVFPSQIIPVMDIGLFIALFLIFIARPVGVFLSLAFFKQTIPEKLFISWVGLRGAAPIVFATIPLIAGIDKAPIIFDVVFFVVLVSVTLQGTTIPVVSRWLGLAKPVINRPKQPAELELSEETKTELIELMLPPESPADNQPIVSLNFPKSCLIVLINRNGKYLTPRGSTILQAQDKLMIMLEDLQEIPKIHEILGIVS